MTGDIRAPCKESVDTLRRHVRTSLQLLQRILVFELGFTASQIIIRDIGKLGEDGESADEKHQIPIGKVAELLDQRDDRAALAMFGYDVAS